HHVSANAAIPTCGGYRNTTYSGDITGQNSALSMKSFSTEYLKKLNREAALQRLSAAHFVHSSDRMPTRLGCFS
ncbi:MAG TPA: hypothetical protein V6C72_07695, partial [Chroococcales cyanobacterium]